MKYCCLFFLFLVLHTHAQTNNTIDSIRQYHWDNLPNPTNYTNDFENILRTNEEDVLNQYVAVYNKKLNVQICIVTIDSTFCSNERFDDFALHIANTWGVGDKKKNNGITICICNDYRKIRICNGYGIEKRLTDAETKQIVEEVFIPYLKNNKYLEAFIAGINAIKKGFKTKS